MNISMLISMMKLLRRIPCPRVKMLQLRKMSPPSLPLVSKINLFLAGANLHNLSLPCNLNNSLSKKRSKILRVIRLHLLVPVHYKRRIMKAVDRYQSKVLPNQFRKIRSLQSHHKSRPYKLLKIMSAKINQINFQTRLHLSQTNLSLPNYRSSR